MPAGHGFVGKFFVSGKRVPISCRQVYVSCGYRSASALVDAVGEPISILNPFTCVSKLLFDLDCKSYWLEGLDLRLLLIVGKLVRHVIDSHATLLTLES